MNANVNDGTMNLKCSKTLLVQDAKDQVPTRLVVGVMIFFVAFFNYMLRVNMSVNIIAMVPAKANTSTIKSECAALSANASGWDNIDESSIAMVSRQAREPVVFEWTEQQQGYILSSYFWSYALTTLLGGLAAERWGSTRLIFGTNLVAAVTTILSPQAAKLHYSALIVARLIIGLASGSQYPALYWLVARWAPPDQKGMFVSALVGGTIGTVVTWSLTGPLIEGFGWEYAFYFPGLIVFAWSFLWWYLISDSPVQHSRISERERKYILDAIGDKVEQKQNVKIVVPLKSVLTSGPFIACVILHFGSLWGVYFVMTAAPKYLSTALGFNLTSTGGLSSLPYLARMLFSMLFGVIGDIIVKKKWMSTTFMRKFFCIFSHIIPGLLLAGLGYAGCSAALSVTILTMALGSNGAAVLTNLVNIQDLAPNYAASLLGISNGISNIAALFTPLVTASFTKNGNGFAEWRPVFLIGASCYIVTAIYFILFGTGETQKWNHIPNDEENNKDKIQTKD